MFSQDRSSLEFSHLFDASCPKITKTSAVKFDLHRNGETSRFFSVQRSDSQQVARYTASRRTKASALHTSGDRVPNRNSNMRRTTQAIPALDASISLCQMEPAQLDSDVRLFQMYGQLVTSPFSRSSVLQIDSCVYPHATTLNAELSHFYMRAELLKSPTEQLLRSRFPIGLPAV